ncbi:hypothetical protein [Oceaniferula spumae]
MKVNSIIIGALVWVVNFSCIAGEGLIGARVSRPHDLDDIAAEIVGGKRSFSDDELLLTARGLWDLFDSTDRPALIAKLVSTHAEWKAINNLILETRAKDPKKILPILLRARDINFKATKVLAERHFIRALANNEVEFTGRIIDWYDDNGFDHKEITKHKVLLELINSVDFWRSIKDGDSFSTHYLLKTYLARLDKPEQSLVEIPKVIRIMEKTWDSDEIMPPVRRGDPFGTRALFRFDKNKGSDTPKPKK